jgi:hypothetical protein
VRRTKDRGVMKIPRRRDESKLLQKLRQRRRLSPPRSFASRGRRLQFIIIHSSRLRTSAAACINFCSCKFRFASLHLPFSTPRTRDNSPTTGPLCELPFLDSHSLSVVLVVLSFPITFSSAEQAPNRTTFVFFPQN